MPAQLVAIAGPLEGVTFTIDGELSIGRDQQNTLAIEGPRAVTPPLRNPGGDGKYSLRDLGSSNGTYVNGLPVTMRMLNDGDQITAGPDLFLSRRRRGGDRPALYDGPRRYQSAQHGRC